MDVDIRSLSQGPSAASRAGLVPEIARRFRSPEAREFLLAATGRNDHTIIPVMPDDTVKYTLDRLREASGRGLVVMLREDGRGFYCAIFLPPSPADVEEAEHQNNIINVREDCSVSMLFTCLRVTKGPMVIRRIAAVQLMDGDLSSA